MSGELERESRVKVLGYQILPWMELCSNITPINRIWVEALLNLRYIGHRRRYLVGYMGLEL